jgi:hypothetical protein
MKSKLLLLTFFATNLIWGVPNVDTLKFNDNSKTLELDKQDKSILFFCPLNATSEESYLEKFDILFKKKKIQILDSLTFKIIFFSSNSNRSKGLKVKIKGIESVILINEFNCIFQNFPNKNIIKHASRIETQKYFETEFYFNTSVSNVKIREDVSCFTSLADRIPVYENYILQLSKPVYSDSEMIKYLSDSILSSKGQIEVLQNSLTKLTDSLHELSLRYSLLDQRVKSIEVENSKKRKKQVTDIFRSSLHKSENEEE